MQLILPATTFAQWLTGYRFPSVPARREALARRKTLGFIPQGRAEVRCLGGVLWLTEAGSSTDIVLTKGEFHACGTGARLVIEALEDALLEITG